MIVSLDRYFLARCVLPWVEVFLTQAIQLPNGTSLMRCRLLRLLTGVYFKRESFETSRALAHEMLALAETLPESPETLGWALYWVVQHALTERDWATVHHYWERLWSMYPCHEDFELHIQIHYLAGYIPYDQLPLWYNAATWFVYPSLYEGFGLPALQALACGTPAIVSRASSLPEVVGEAALLVDPQDVEALAAALRRATHEPALAEYLREAGPRQALRFPWSRTARETVAVYRDVLERRVGHA